MLPHPESERTDSPQLEWPLRITLPGEPIGKGRPRVRVISYGNRRPVPAFYSPKTTRDYENALRTVAVLAMRGRKPIEGAVHVVIGAYFGIPKSWSEIKRRSSLGGLFKHTKRPDCDNVEKVCLDSLNKIVYDDDAQIVTVFVFKTYSDNPRLVIEVTPS